MRRRHFLLGTAAAAGLMAVAWRGTTAVVPARPWFHPLTPRQAAVSMLVADGLSNSEIAQTLFMNQTTVAYHVHCIFNRLGFQFRSQIIDWAAKNRPGPSELARPRLAPLTTGESKIAELIAAGFTNGEIAKSLGRSERTIQVRVHMIVTKLDLSHRSQIVRWVGLHRPSNPPAT
jgi:DNA-binding NarL/FixJ family response regulator